MNQRGSPAHSVEESDTRCVARQADDIADTVDQKRILGESHGSVDLAKFGSVLCLSARQLLNLPGVVLDCRDACHLDGKLQSDTIEDLAQVDEIAKDLRPTFQYR